VCASQQASPAMTEMGQTRSCGCFRSTSAQAPQAEFPAARHDVALMPILLEAPRPAGRDDENRIHTPPIKGPRFLDLTLPHPPDRHAPMCYVLSRMAWS